MSLGTLTQYLDNQYPFLSTLLKFSLVDDIISGPCYIHSQNIVHGHLTGFNVLIDESGRACLANYDLADLLVAHYSVVQEPRWTDPQLICGAKSRLPTMSADVYAFGCIMLQILVGNLPYWWIRNSHVGIEQSPRTSYRCRMTPKFPNSKNSTKNLFNDAGPLLTPAHRALK